MGPITTGAPESASAPADDVESVKRAAKRQTIRFSFMFTTSFALIDALCGEGLRALPQKIHRETGGFSLCAAGYSAREAFLARFILNMVSRELTMMSTASSGGCMEESMLMSKWAASRQSAPVYRL